jgi:hypothetical protein
MSWGSWPWSGFGDFLFALPALLLFAHGALSHIDVPGMYFDAVNPDYLALKLFTLTKTVPAYVPPGQLLFGKLPVLIAIYHGALPFYLGLPVYLLFGTDIVGVRIANCVFGVLVLVGMALALRAFRIRPAAAGAAMAALALDPGFVLDFRTQFYITTLPITLVFASIGLLECEGATPSRRTAFLAGGLAGLSVSGDADAHVARQELCHGRDAVLAVHDEPRAKRIDDWSAAIGVPPTEVRTYSQRDGVPVMVSVRWRVAAFDKGVFGK